MQKSSKLLVANRGDIAQHVGNVWAEKIMSYRSSGGTNLPAICLQSFN